MFSSSRQLRTKEDKFRHKIRRPVDTDRLSCVRWTALGSLWRACFKFFLKKKNSFMELSSVPPSRGKKQKRNRFVSSSTLAYCRGKGVSSSPPPRNFAATSQSPAPTTSSRKFEKVKYPQRWAAYSSLGKILPSIRWEQKRSDRKRKTPKR